MISFYLKTPEKAESTTSSLPELPFLTSVGPPPILQVKLAFVLLILK
jgi:hypothetical protein